MVIDNIDEFIKVHNIKQIFLDVDGVIFASCQAVIDLLNEKYGGNFNGSDVGSWDFKCCYPSMTSDEIEEVFNDPRFFDVVKPIDGALDFMDRYRDKITIVTKANIPNYAMKRKWFDNKGFNDIEIIALPLNIDKGFINMNRIGIKNSLFIDDSTKNLMDSNAMYKVMFKEYNDKKEREWQKDWYGRTLYHW